MSKTLNKIAYRFLFKRALNLFFASLLPIICIAQTNAADAILFTIVNQKLITTKNTSFSL